MLCYVIVFDMQRIESIPDGIKKLYKTVWEISQKTIIKMAADRGAYIDQSQSLNLHFAEPDKNKLNSAHFYAWKMVCWLAVFDVPYLLLHILVGSAVHNFGKPVVQSV